MKNLISKVHEISDLLERNKVNYKSREVMSDKEVFSQYWVEDPGQFADDTGMFYNDGKSGRGRLLDPTPVNKSGYIDEIKVIDRSYFMDPRRGMIKIYKIEVCAVKPTQVGQE